MKTTEGRNISAMHFFGQVKLVERQADITPLQKEFLELAMEALLKPKKDASKPTDELLKEQIDKRKKRNKQALT